MAIDITFCNKVVSRFNKVVIERLEESKSVLKAEEKNLLYLKSKILQQSDKLYLTPFVSKLIGDTKLEFDIKFITNVLFELNRNIFNVSQNAEIEKLIKVYMKAFCESYINREKVKKDVILYSKINSLDQSFVMFVLRKYLFSIQYILLLGLPYFFDKVRFTIKIFGKSVIKKGKPILNNIKNVDWGESIKFLKERSKELDIELYEQFEKGYISRKQFISAMGKYNLKWHIYINKDFNHWLILKSYQSPIDHARMYGITPNNFVRNKTRSQIDFTDKHGTIEEIIETDKLGLRDKIRALERINMDYCLKTFNNDLQYNQ